MNVQLQLTLSQVCAGCISDTMEVREGVVMSMRDIMEGVVMNMLELMIWYDGDNDIECGVDSGSM